MAQLLITADRLVSNASGSAPITDPRLIHPWELSRESGTDWWISDNLSGVCTLYNGAGTKNSLVVTIPPSRPDEPEDAYRQSNSHYLQRPVGHSVAVSFAWRNTAYGWMFENQACQLDYVHKRYVLRAVFGSVV
jgi:hypothetical protein